VAAVASAACLPRRDLAAPGVAGRSVGHITRTMTSTMMTTAGHQPLTTPRCTMPGSPPAELTGSPLADISRVAR